MTRFQFQAQSFARSHTMISGIDLGCPRDATTTIVQALAMPGCAALLSVRTGRWTAFEVAHLTADTIVVSDRGGEMFGGHTIRFPRGGIERLAAHVALGRWVFPASPSREVRGLLDDAKAWTPASKASDALVAWWLCDALISEQALTRQPPTEPASPSWL